MNQLVPAPSQTSERSSVFSLEGHVAVVTGGARGLGFAIAGGLADFGADVVIASRNEEALAYATELLATKGGNISYKSCNVASEDDVAALENYVAERFGGADILINNAGINPNYKRAEKTTLKEWQEVIAVNLTGVFLGCRIFGQRMLEKGAGSIVNVSSVAGHVGLPRTTAYCGAKGGVEIMSKSLAIEWAARGVRVNCIAPGYFETDLTAGLRDNASLSQNMLSQTPQGRFGRPEELIGAAVFLASPASAYVTGQTILVDGGWTAQ